MNKERILAVADAIEKETHDITFDMMDYYSDDDCGTSACIAGYAILQHDPSLLKDLEYHNHFS